MPFSSIAFAAAAFAFLSTACALDLPHYTGLKTSLNHSVLEVTFHNPNSAINLWNQDTTDGMTDLVRRLQQDNETKVVIFQSDVPRYFMAHLDLSMPNLGT
jgi:enoyl-CoA hydratase/carnithine racemase